MKIIQFPAVILVADDEPLIRMNTADTLAELGFSTIEARDAEDALTKLKAHPEIAVLFTDINMPGSFDGLELARRVRGLRPDLQVIVTSGKMKPSQIEIPNGAMFISKPYTSRAIADLITSARSEGVCTPCS
ncbi:response regulator [Novosphingobium sp. AP12]|uniref:response regulator n=1 Tax=Novosphingobium sp. AP12 TaxID=1144305 RepID=UPI00068A8B36|nr:response regulator [Novosphingobium sp. AP12]